MSFTKAVRVCLFEYSHCAGRASRTEFWYFVLFIILVCAAAREIDYFVLHRFLLEWVVPLLLALPLWAVTVRRLHDTDRTGWWLLLMLFPVLGALMVFIGLASAGTDWENPYGPPIEFTPALA